MAKLRKRLLLDAIIVILGSAAIIVPLAIFGPGARQRRNLRKADQHIPVIQRILGSDRRFSKIEVKRFTGHDGCIMVHGDLDLIRDYDDLKAIVGSTAPPVGVAYYVSIDGKDQPGEYLPQPEQ